ncbi:hypothetical protein LK542_10250 [Massilia sp. IC2-477]|uniref:hypothetical protein n=1 Tax=unclassified Massilia TaxID=2609279 RepID=UPI001D0FB3B8|nr:MULTISPECIES: hypothetical protein [unclassified Massilia]MCC2955994.1 hypothetical protein [Massilia sp. IC2-477]MCC2970577.1 hypothetical protein [Massilia sp. IC2-476]
MKKFLMAAAACTLLGGCAYYVPSTGENVAQNDDGRYVPTGSNIPRKKGEGTSNVSTLSKVELESARMDAGSAPVIPANQQ